MLYTDYYKRFSKLVSAMSFAKRHWIPILIAVLAVLAATVALTSTKGLVYDKNVPPPTVYYGEEYEYRAGAFMTGKLAYEYRTADGEWSGEKPMRAGDYYVRAVSYRAFGIMSYGNEHAFTVLPKPIEVKVESPATYGENPAVSAELCYDDTIACDGFEYGNIALSETTVRAILANVKITSGDGADVTDSYALTAPEYGIVFDKRSIEITVADTSEAYDGNPHAFGGVEVTRGTLADGDTVSAVFDGTLTEVGEIADIEPELVITSRNGYDVTGNYDITLKAGKLAVTPQVLTVKTASATKVYDGAALSAADGYEIMSGALAEGHELVRSSNYVRITDAGTAKNVLSFTVSDGDEDVTKNYAIALEAGTLEITPAPVTVVTKSFTWTYDGNAHGGANKTDITVSGVLTALGHSWSVASSARITDVGTTDNTVELKFTDGNGKDISGNYSTTVDCGTLEIAKRSVTLETGSGEWIYDGTAHYNEGFAVASGSNKLVFGHSVKVTGHTEITDVVRDADNGVGSVANELSVSVFFGNTDVTGNYEISFSCGTLKITPRPVTIKAASAEKIYDDTPLIFNSCNDLTENLVGKGILRTFGHYASVVCDGEITDAGMAENRIVEYDILCDGQSVLYNYSVTVSNEAGILEVTPRYITVATASGEWIYDGYTHSANEVKEVKAYGNNDPPLVSDHAVVTSDKQGDYTTVKYVKYSEYAENCEIGTENIITPIVKSGDIDKTRNYRFVFEYGSLTVKFREITIKPVNKTKVYDDTSLTSNEIEIISETGLADGDKWGVIACDGSITDVGTEENEIVGWSVFDADNTNVTYNYLYTRETGALSVTARKITVVSEDKLFVYNGYEQSRKEYEISSEYADGALAAKHVSSVTEFATIRLVSQSPVENRLIIAIEKDGKDKTSNYDITYVYGNLTMDRLPVYVLCGSRGAYGDGDWIYDGTPHVWTQFELKAQNADAAVPNCDAFEFDPSAGYSSITEVVYNADGSLGSLENLFSLTVTETLDDETVADKSDNYILEYVGGWLTLNPRPIAVKAKDAEKEYDGEPLTSDEFEIVSEYDIIDGETGAAKCDGSITDVGTTDNNIVEFVITRDGDGKDVTRNYDITYEKGALTVTARAITVTTASGEWEYDGEFHSDKSVEVTSGSLIDVHVISADERDGAPPIPEVRDVNAPDGEQNKFRVKIMLGDDEKTQNYNITYEYGTLLVTKFKVTVTTADKSWVYDGKEHKGDEKVVGITDYTLNRTVYDDHAIGAVDDGITDVGTKDNVFTVVFTRDGNDVSGNYEATYVYGALEITPLAVTVTTESKEWTYDGETHSYAKYSVSCGSTVPDAHAVDTARAVAEITDVELDAGGNVTGIANELFVKFTRGGKDVSGNYDITYEYGTLKINPLGVTVYTATKIWIYDGAEHTSIEPVAGIADCTALPSIPASDRVVADTAKAYSSIVDVIRDGKGNVIGCDNEFTVKFMRGGEDVSRNYTVTRYEYGELIVLPRPITITSADNEWTYDGKEHYDDGFSVSSAYDPPLATVGNQSITVIEHTVVRDVMRDESGNAIGTDNVIVVKITTANGLDKTGNYDIGYVCGELKINPLAVTVTTESKEWTYDGASHSYAKYSVDCAAPLPDAHSLDTTRTVAEITDVARDADGKVIGIDNELFVKFTRGEKDVSYNYDISYEYGELKLNPVTVYFTTGSAQRYFDGTPLTCETATIDNAPFVAEHKGVLTATGTQTFAGSSDNTAELTVFDGDRDVSGNYELVPSAAPGGIGKLTVLPIKIKVVTGSAKKEYDGTPLKCETYDTEIIASTDGKMPTGHTLSVEFGDGLTDAGSIDNAVTVKVTFNGEDMTDGYEFSYELGTLTVTARKITINTSTNSWTYDGEPHMGSIRYVTDDMFASGQSMRIVSFTSITNVGAKTNEIKINVFDSTNKNVTDNYEITYNFGTLTVTARPITVTTANGEWVYDGQAHSAPAFEITSGSLASGQVAELFEGTETFITNVGTKSNVLQIVIKSGGNTVTTNYAIKWVYGTLEVTRRPVIVQTASHKWKYDGNAHYDNSGDAADDSPYPLVDGHKIIGEDYVTVTEVGSVSNIYTVKIFDGETDVTDNYSIIKVVTGSLTIVSGGGGGGFGGSGGLGPIGGDGSLDDEVILSIKTDYKGTLYLRSTSYGEYVLGQKESFNPADEYPYTMTHDDGKFALTYLTSAALESMGVSTRSVDIRLEGMGYYVLPYYVSFDGNAQTSDVAYTGSSLEYTAAFYPYSTGGWISEVPERYAAAENKYYEFVKTNYTDIPQSTLDYMKRVIALQDFDVSAKDGDMVSRLALIDSVAKFVRSAATYSTEYDRALDDETDPAVEFLRTYREGICQHYAKSGTMLFRALGFPARYVVGAMAESDGSGEWQEIKGESAHAWVEVYIKGVGWIQVECTGSASGNGGGGGGGSGSGGGNGEPPKDFTVKPLDIYVEYGETARPENVVVEDTGALQYWLKSGYTYSVSVTGERSELGTGYSMITEFKMFDPSGTDVTDQYAIAYDFGKLCVTKPQVNVYIYSLQKQYNGAPLEFSADDYEVMNCPSGYTLELKLEGIGIDSNFMTIEGLRDRLKSRSDWYSVKDASGADVTVEFAQNYCVLPYIDFDIEALKTDMSEIYVLEITPRPLRIMSGSAIKAYDGTPLTAHTATVTFGSLLPGHTIEYAFNAEITDVGEISNIFDCIILDGNGNDVTNMYEILRIYGGLKVIY